MSKHVLPVLLLLTVFAGRLVADEVILKDGRKFTGEVVQETGRSVSIKTIGGVLTFPRSQVVRVTHKADPRKTYRDKDNVLVRREVVARMELGKWCMTHSLPNQARRQFELVLQIDPQHAEALQSLSKLTGPRKHVRAPDVDIILTDDSRIKGRLINSTVTLELLYGTLRIPSGQITAIRMGDPRSTDSVETTVFKARGEIKDQTFIVDTKLGRLSVSKKDIKSFTVRKLTPEQLEQAAFLGAMRRLNRTGIDVMVVMDTTDTMSGTVKAFVAGSPKLWDFLHKHVPNTQVGVVSYRDTKVNNPDDFEYVLRSWPLTGDRDVFLGNVKGLDAKGGGDIPEAVYEGLKEAVERGGWRADAARIIVLVGDAPPHKENKGMQRTLQLATDWNRKSGGVLHTIDTTGWSKLMYDYINLAKAGGGQSLSLHQEKRLIRTLAPLILPRQWRDRLLADFEGKPYRPPKPKPKPPEQDPDDDVITIER